MEGSADTAEQAAKFYCPQCGARYSGPGVCVNGHGEAEVLPLDTEAAAQDGTELATAPPAAEPTAATIPAPSTDAADVAAVIAGLRDGLDHLEQLVTPPAAA